MSTRRWGWAAIALLLGALALGGAGAAALAAGNEGSHGGASATSGSAGGYGPMGPMGGYGPGGMMGPSGGMMGPSGGMMGPSGGMMGGGWGGQGQTPAGTPSAGVTQVAMQNFAFQPATIQVKAGTAVTWTNQDSASHTVTFRNGMKDSGMLRQGQSFSYTFTQPGTYAYYCAYHANMAGDVIVTA